MVLIKDYFELDIDLNPCDYCEKFEPNTDHEFPCNQCVHNDSHL